MKMTLPIALTFIVMVGNAQIKEKQPTHFNKDSIKSWWSSKCDTIITKTDFKIKACEDYASNHNLEAATVGSLNQPLITSLNVGDGGTLYIVKDTIICYFQIITGVVKGNLMGRWIKGWVVAPRSKNNFLIIGEGIDYKQYEPFYLYPDKKTRVTQKVINHY
jgi:hypothetical protein